MAEKITVCHPTLADLPPNTTSTTTTHEAKEAKQIKENETLWPRSTVPSSQTLGQPRGMLTWKSLCKRVKFNEIECVVVAFTDLYGRLQGKRIDAEAFVARNVVAACDYLLACDMDMNPIKGFKSFSWEKGFGDFVLKPDLDTLRICSWHSKTAMVLCDVVNHSGQCIDTAPRAVLKAQVQRCAGLGLVAGVATELEYYMYSQSYDLLSAAMYRDLQPIAAFVADYSLLQASKEEKYHSAFRHHLRHSGVPVEGSKCEAGRGQHELNTVYTGALTAADRHAVYKQCLKEVSNQMGVAVTFMAKPHTDQAGSSCHLHVSLWHSSGGNAFYDPTSQWEGLQVSSIFRYFLGGLMRYLPEMMPFLAPTVNSYKRYVEESWAPTRLAWSAESRSTGIRVVGEEESTRLEIRLPGADANAYLAVAAVLACGLEGLENHLSPPPATHGNVYSTSLPLLPRCLSSATDAFSSSDFARRVLGSDVVDHYAHFYRSEVSAYMAQVTDWERQRYFERI